MILQTLKVGYPTIHELANLKNDYEESRRIDHKWVLKSHDLIQDQEEFVLIKEHYPGIPLITFIADWLFDIT